MRKAYQLVWVLVASLVVFQGTAVAQQSASDSIPVGAALASEAPSVIETPVPPSRPLPTGDADRVNAEDRATNSSSEASADPLRSSFLWLLLGGTVVVVVALLAAFRIRRLGDLGARSFRNLYGSRVRRQDLRRSEQRANNENPHPRIDEARSGREGGEAQFAARTDPEEASNHVRPKPAARSFPPPRVDARPLGWPEQRDRWPFYTPEEALSALTGAALSDPRLSLEWGLPWIPSVPWVMGAATHVGRVRSENQDFVLGFQCGPLSALYVADGAGGVPMGGEASRAAGFAAARGTLRELAAGGGAFDTLETLAWKAIEHGAVTLRSIGARRGISTLAGGLRTTLQVVLADAQRVAYAQIGDGGAFLVRRSGEVLSLMEPQRDEAGRITATLGPIPHGAPTAIELERRPGDLVAAMSDGASDIVSPEFPLGLVERIAHREGDVQGALVEVVESLGKSPPCTDNVSLVALGTGEPTADGPGFRARMRAHLEAPESSDGHRHRGNRPVSAAQGGHRFRPPEGSRKGEQ